MVELWKPRGGTMETSWWNYGNLMVELWKPHGGTVETSWRNCGNLMVELWKPRGGTVPTENCFLIHIFVSENEYLRME